MFKFVLLFTILGFSISLVSGLTGGSRFFSLFTTAVVCALISSVLGAGIYKLLEKKIPETLSVLNTFQAAFSRANVPDIDKGKSIEPHQTVQKKHSADRIAPLFSEQNKHDPSKDASFSLKENEVIEPKAVSPGSYDYGKHVVMNKIKIKNEPKLMAEAVRTMLMRESESGKA